MMKFPGAAQVFLILYGLTSPLAWASERLEAPPPPTEFRVNERLRKNVEFWVKIYTKFLSSEGVIHDAKYVDHVYESFRFENQSNRNLKTIKLAEKKWKGILISVHRKLATHGRFTEDEKRVFEMYQDVNEPNKFLNAAHRKRLRFQQGLRDSFLDGLYQSGKYLPWMEEIFKAEQMPLELTRLPFVESSFNIRARSKVGASGIWQFMRSTGRVFLTINEAVDERNDPIRATEAAAQLLRLNYTSLKKWPLAVTAYNHGRKGMMRAVRRVGSDELDELIAEYRNRSFGFASSNFFTELLAAVEVERHPEIYFGQVLRAKPLNFVEIRVPDYIEIHELLSRLKLDPNQVRELNPGLTEPVYLGKLLVPAGYRLRIPSSTDQSTSEERERVKKAFLEKYTAIPIAYKQRHQKLWKLGTPVKAQVKWVRRRPKPASF